MAMRRRSPSTTIDRQGAAGATGPWHSRGPTAIFGVMLLGLTRRIFAALVSVALMLGPAGYSAQAASMSAKAVMAMSSDMHSPAKCDDCGGNKAGVPAGACALNCSGIVAVSPGAAAFVSVPDETHGAVFAPIMIGLDTPPDPYPPRSTVLS